MSAGVQSGARFLWPFPAARDVERLERRRHKFTPQAILLAAAMAAFPFHGAAALIMGGEGNAPIADPGWPAGAAAIFNNKARIAWWEGPPFGGGEWHAECRGDAKVFNEVLAAFAHLDVKIKRIVLHDGIGHSFWLNPNREPAKEAAARMDWAFQIWEPANWERLRKFPASFSPTNAADVNQGPPAQIDIYTGGNLRWSEVTMPEGLEVVDQRLEAHGFTPADGIVLEGKVFDLTAKQPVAARMRFERIEPQAKGGYQYVLVAESLADAGGHWVLKKAPAGWHRVVIEAEGFVPRVVGYAQFDDQPRWSSYECGLARPAPVAGRVVDEAGQPLADVQVRIHDLVPEAGGRYETPEDSPIKTDADGRFRSDQLPKGKATIWVHKSGYCRPGLGEVIETPKTGIQLGMIKSARVRITVDFMGKERPGAYIVHMVPDGGEAVGKWSGSGNIDADNQIYFNDIPPGRYVLRGQPNPGSEDQKTEPVAIELKGGQAKSISLPAR